MPDRQKELRAAEDLEALIPELQEIVTELQAGSANPYTLVYDFRTKVGRVVSTLGYGLPERPRGMQVNLPGSTGNTQTNYFS